MRLQLQRCSGITKHSPHWGESNLLAESVVLSVIFPLPKVIIYILRSFARNNIGTKAIAAIAKGLKDNKALKTLA